MFPCLVMLEPSIAALEIVPVKLVAGRVVKLAPEPEKRAAGNVPDTVPLKTKNVDPDWRLLVSWMALPRLATGTLPVRFPAVRLVKLDAFKAVKLPEPFIWTN